MPPARSNPEHGAPATTQGPGRLRDAQKQLTRTRLLEAAASLIARHGYTAATIDDIAVAAGVTRATVYLHFRSKSELALKMREAIGGYDPTFAALVAAAGAPSSDALAAWLAGFAAHLDAHHEYALALREAADADRTVRSTLERRRADLAAELAVSLASGRRWTADHGVLVATLLLRQLDLVRDGWLLVRPADDRQDVCRTLAAMWHVVLRA